MSRRRIIYDVQPTPLMFVVEMELRGWSAGDCAQALQVSVGTVEDWMQGRRAVNPTAWKLMRLIRN